MDVGTVITLGGLPTNFTISGLPGEDIFSELVDYTVTTNAFGGYSVTVQSETAEMSPTTPGNPDTIPISLLQVSNSEGGWGYTVSDTETTSIEESRARSGPGGDQLSSQFRMTIPFVTDDTYTATIDFVASTF